MKRIVPVLFMLSANALWGQSHELWFSGGASILWNHTLGSLPPGGAPDDVTLSSGFREGIRFGYNSAGHIGHEIQYGYNKTNLTDSTGLILPDKPEIGMAFHQAGYNILYYFNSRSEEAKLRTFATGGIHFSDLVLPGAASIQGGSVKAGFNYGVGIKVKISTLFATRFDLRQYETGKPNWKGILAHQGGLLHQAEASAGIGFFF